MDIASIVYLTICCLLVGFLVWGTFKAISNETKDYNNGKCPNCGGKWRAFDSDSGGGIGLICDKCHNYIWVNWIKRRALSESLLKGEDE